MRTFAAMALIFFCITIIGCICDLIFPSETSEIGNSVVGVMVSIPFAIFFHLYLRKEARIEVTRKENKIPNLQDTNGKFRFWSNIQRWALLLFLILFVFCFIWSWWLLIPAALSLVLNFVAYVNKMKLLGRDPATRDINNVV